MYPLKRNDASGQQARRNPIPKLQFQVPASRRGTPAPNIRVKFKNWTNAAKARVATNTPGEASDVSDEDEGTAHAETGGGAKMVERNKGKTQSRKRKHPGHEFIDDIAVVADPSDSEVQSEGLGESIGDDDSEDGREADAEGPGEYTDDDMGDREADAEGRDGVIDNHEDKDRKVRRGISLTDAELDVKLTQSRVRNVINLRHSLNRQMREADSDLRDLMMKLQQQQIVLQKAQYDHDNARYNYDARFAM
ncbi:hypothetical protein PG996_006105 [Apiospora saccharicola]|uniref:Uncharacterized protein n=1 Tax=Apiospora saccharicola TaxID=335842 RepID=A0ABR1VPF7_9PEZI